MLESLAVTPVDYLFEIGSTDQFSATGTYSDNTTQDLTTAVNWTSSASSIASISNASGSQGLATGVAKGTATISAALDGITGSTTLSVTPTLESIAISPASLSLPKGETERFTATGSFADNSTENLTQDGDVGLLEHRDGDDLKRAGINRCRPGRCDRHARRSARRSGE